MLSRWGEHFAMCLSGIAFAMADFIGSQGGVLDL
jgi:hypothetical protein